MMNIQKSVLRKDYSMIKTPQKYIDEIDEKSLEECGIMPTPLWKEDIGLFRSCHDSLTLKC